MVTLDESRSRDIYPFAGIQRYAVRNLSVCFPILQKGLFDDVHDSFITRTQRLAQRLLKRKPGRSYMEHWRYIIRTQTIKWRCSELFQVCIRSEPLTLYIRKTSDVFTVVMNTRPSSRSNVEHQSVLANNMEEIMVKVRVRHTFDKKLIPVVLILLSQVAELDYFMRSRTGNGWAS